MPFPVIGAALAGVNALGGIIGNRARAGQAQKDRDFQRAEAATQMKFQERMRNTEWQSAVADMRAAGINPALAYQQGGASSPGGAAGGGSRADQADVLSSGVSSALQYKRLAAEVKQINAQTAKTDAEKDQIESRPGRIGTPAVDAAVGTIEALFQPKTMQILKYELGTSAKSIRDALSRVVGRINRAAMRPPATIRMRDDDSPAARERRRR